MKFAGLAINDAKKLIFGKAPHPVRTRRGIVIGSGSIYAELNFTLLPMEVSISNQHRVIEHYRQITRGALERAVDLRCDGVVLEFEALIEMTKYPKIGLKL